MLAHIEANKDVWIGWSWWAAGPWWGEYMFTIEPQNISTTPVDRPVMSVLIPHVPIPCPTLEFVPPSQFSYETQTGFVYQPQVASSLPGGAWTAYGSSFTGNGSAPVVAMSPTGDQGYYRVRVSRNP
jgi:hypothetical protein